MCAALDGGARSWPSMISAPLGPSSIISTGIEGKILKMKQRKPCTWIFKVFQFCSSCNILIVFNLSLMDFQDCKSSHNLSGWKKKGAQRAYFFLNFKSRVKDVGQDEGCNWSNVFPQKAV